MPLDCPGYWKADCDDGGDDTMLPSQYDISRLRTTTCAREGGHGCRSDHDHGHDCGHSSPADGAPHETRLRAVVRGRPDALLRVGDALGGDEAAPLLVAVISALTHTMREAI